MVKSNTVCRNYVFLYIVNMYNYGTAQSIGKEW